MDAKDIRELAEDVQVCLQDDPFEEELATRVACTLFRCAVTPAWVLTVLAENDALRQGIEQIINEGYSSAMEVTDALHYLLVDTLDTRK